MQGVGGRPQSQAQQWRVLPGAEPQLWTENETGELMSSGEAQAGSVLIPSPWEQPGMECRLGPGWAAGSPLGARPAGQLPARASRQPARPPCVLLPPLGPPVAWWFPEAHVTAVCSPGCNISPAFPGARAGSSGQLPTALARAENDGGGGGGE